MSGYEWPTVEIDGRKYAEIPIQLNLCCGIRSYRPLGKPPHTCTVCGNEIEGGEYETFRADITPQHPDGCDEWGQRV